MARTKICVAVVVCVVGFFAILSCAKPFHVLSFDCADAGKYEVDVVKWVLVKTPTDTFYSGTVTDAMIRVTGFYAQPGDGMAHNSGPYEAQLQKYEVTWPQGSGIPKTFGGLDVLVQSDMGRSKGSTFDIVMMPATNKDTVGVLAALWGDPETRESAGDLDVTATVKMTGKDLVTNEDISDEFKVAVFFADYGDPNNIP